MSNMSAKMVASYFQNENLKFDIDGEDEEIIRINFNADNVESVRISLFFDKEDKNVAIRSFNICKVEEAKKAKIYQVMSKLNDDFRWVKFSIDENDNTVTASTDAVIRMDVAGEICYELVFRMVNIVDDAYPEIMKALWA
ncbi:MAG: YbjN domain-containing protein [Lachnospiraceae bacterium]|nr:YbjN domain-containing protein [Lachnospiraceae bacterium]MDD6504602.1 YbjN domain-containing protein [Lachnospiraceae bacterium]